MTKPTLKKILSDLLDRAKATPGLGVSFNLKHGLTLHMKIDLDNTSLLHLGISRHETDPSEKEWDIVCRDCGLPKVSYSKREYKDRKYLVAEFNLQPELIS